MSSPESESGATGGRTRVIAGAVLSPLVFVALWVAPLPIPEDAHRLAAIFAAVLVAWVTEVVPLAVTALLIAPAMVAAGVTDAEEAFAPYADPLLFLFVGGFFIARAMARHGLDRRLAGALVSLPFIRAIPWRTRVALVAASLFLSMWISNTASTAILLPILLGMSGVGLDGGKGDDRSPAARSLAGNLLCVAFGCSLAGLGTVVGSPPNGITVRLLNRAGIEFGFLDWMQIGIPCAVLMLVGMYFLFHFGTPAVAPAREPFARGERQPFTRGEITTSISFALAVVGWVFPDVYAVLGGPGADAVKDALPSGAVALVAAAPLFLVPDPRAGERVLPWHDATKIDWGIILLFGGGISLGTQMLQTGLASIIARGFVDVTGVEGLWTLTILLTLITIPFTELCSNTAAANMLVPIALGIAGELGVSPIPPVLAVGIAASCGFMLPIATGPNALVYGTGRVPQGTMIRYGFLLDLVCAAAIIVLLRILCPLYGWV
jgi:sodium-dependent dicarboxylate transporter 2/3/5